MIITTAHYLVLAAVLFSLAVAGIFINRKNVILLVAIIAAISLTLRARKDSKRMDPSEQVKAKKADRVRIVSMKPEPVAHDAASDAAAPVGDRR